MYMEWKLAVDALQKGNSDRVVLSSVQPYLLVTISHYQQPVSAMHVKAPKKRTYPPTIRTDHFNNGHPKPKTSIRPENKRSTTPQQHPIPPKLSISHQNKVLIAMSYENYSQTLSPFASIVCFSIPCRGGLR